MGYPALFVGQLQFMLKDTNFRKRMLQQETVTPVLVRRNFRQCSLRKYAYQCPSVHDRMLEHEKCPI